LSCIDVDWRDLVHFATPTLKLKLSKYGFNDKIIGSMQLNLEMFPKI